MQFAQERGFQRRQQQTGQNHSSGTSWPLKIFLFDAMTHFQCEIKRKRMKDFHLSTISRVIPKRIASVATVHQWKSPRAWIWSSLTYNVQDQEMEFVYWESNDQRKSDRDWRERREIRGHILRRLNLLILFLQFFIDAVISTCSVGLSAVSWLCRSCS